MVHRIQTAQWISAIQQELMVATDGDCFLLPSPIHKHAFTIAKEAVAPEKWLIVEVQS